VDTTRFSALCIWRPRLHRVVGLVAALLLISLLTHGPLPIPGCPDTAEAAGRKVTLTIVNASEVEICYVYLAPSDGDDWGDDWLGAKNTIPPGESHTMRLTDGEYDARAEDCDHNVLSEVQSATISDDMKWTVRGSDAATDQDTNPPKGQQPTPTHEVALNQFLCCGKSVGETNIWSIRYPGGWKVEYFGTPDAFTGAAFFDPQGSIRITFLPSAMPEAGGTLDTGEVESFLDGLVQMRRGEDAGLKEFLRQPVPGIEGARIWGATWPGQDDQMWEAYLVFVAPLMYIAPEVPQTYFTLMGVRAASPAWAAGVKIYEDMLKTVQVKWLKDTSAKVDAVEMGKPAVEAGMVRFCPKECDWEWISASQPGWACPVYGEESYPYEVPCESPGSEEQ
jgi:hypothetical protein